MIQAVLVALNNGEVRVYNDKYFITTIKIDAIVTGMQFGVFGREEGCLIMNFKSGGLCAKILQRQADLSTSTIKPGPPPLQDVPLNVPKKTKLYVELTQREKDQCQDMHKQFQKDLIRIRLKTAQTYIQMLSDGNAPMSYALGSQIRLNA
jgi:Bardet-Biedl syndrome 1 protein